MSEPDDKKVKELLDSATRADLERWFGLPSYEQLAERGVQPPPPAEDPEFAAIRNRRDEAIASVDPAMVEWHRRRTTPPPDGIAQVWKLSVAGSKRTSVFGRTPDSLYQTARFR